MLLDQNQPAKIEKCNSTLKEVTNARKLTIVQERIMKKLKEIEIYSDKCGITLTLKKKYHDDDDIWMHRYIQDKINKSIIWKKKNYILFPEFTKKGILHYHGVIWGSYQIEVIKMAKWWRRSLGFVKLELKINNYKNWMNYITKDYGKTGLWTINRY